MWHYGSLNGNNSHWFIGNGTIGRYGLVGWCVGFQKPKASKLRDTSPVPHPSSCCHENNGLNF